MASPSEICKRYNLRDLPVNYSPEDKVNLREEWLFKSWIRPQLEKLNNQKFNKIGMKRLVSAKWREFNSTEKPPSVPTNAVSALSPAFTEVLPSSARSCQVKEHPMPDVLATLNPRPKRTRHVVREQPVEEDPALSNPNPKCIRGTETNLISEKPSRQQPKTSIVVESDWHQITSVKQLQRVECFASIFSRSMIPRTNTGALRTIISGEEVYKFIKTGVPFAVLFRFVGMAKGKENTSKGRELARIFNMVVLESDETATNRASNTDQTFCILTQEDKEIATAGLLSGISMRYMQGNLTDDFSAGELQATRKVLTKLGQDLAKADGPEAKLLSDTTNVLIEFLS